MRQRQVRIVAAIAIALMLGGCSGTATSNGSAIPNQATQTSDAATAPAAGATSPQLPAASGPIGSAEPASDELPTRIVISDLRIDLPIVSGDLNVAGNPPDYPLCGVAQYLTTYRYPARPGTSTWIYGHAREGMLLPLLEASESHDGRALIGSRVRLYTDGDRRFTYRITEVLRHATDRSSAARVPPESERLIIQTSEGPRGTVPKLQVVAELLDVTSSTAAESVPKPTPRACYSA